MSNRLNQEREENLQPQRMESCQKKLEEMGFDVKSDGSTLLSFVYKGKQVQFWPYSGWHSGATIRDGRGFKHLIDQLEEER